MALILSATCPPFHYFIHREDSICLAFIGIAAAATTSSSSDHKGPARSARGPTGSWVRCAIA